MINLLSKLSIMDYSESVTRPTTYVTTSSKTGELHVSNYFLRLFVTH